MRSMMAVLLDRLDAEDPAALTHAELGTQIVQLRRLLDGLEARWLRRLAAFDRRGAAAAAGAVSTAGWLRAACRLSPGVATDRVQTARRLSVMPATDQALAAGELSYPHARLVTTAVAELAEAAGGDVAAAAEAPLLDTARLVDPARLRRQIAHARHALAPEAAAAAAEQSYTRRRLSVSETFDGTVVLDGVLDPEGGAVLLSALTPLAGPAGPADTRTAPQRRADALVELCRRRLDAGDLPDAGGSGRI